MRSGGERLNQEDALVLFFPGRSAVFLNPREAGAFYVTVYNSRDGRRRTAVCMWSSVLPIDSRLAVNAYVLQGKFSEAEPLYKSSLATRQKVLGRDHDSVAIVLNNYAAMLLSMVSLSIER